MVFYDTAYGKIAFNLDYSNIIVRMSGGFDSAVMLCGIATALRDHGKTASIYPMTVRKIKNPTGDDANDKANPYPVVAGILDYVKLKFPELDIKEPQRLDIPKWWQGDSDKNYTRAQDELLVSIFEKFDLGDDVVSYNGVTKNPEMTIGEEETNPAKNRQVPVIADAIPDTHSVCYQTKKFKCEMEPFRNFDKRIVFSFADRLDVLTDLLEITRSCEGLRSATDNFTTTCKAKPICWWCYEREWAKQNYEK